MLCLELVLRRDRIRQIKNLVDPRGQSALGQQGVDVGRVQGRGLAAEAARGFGQKMVGSIQRCLVTGISKKRLDQLQARTECNRVINFPFHNISFIGKLVDIKVEEALAYSLLGSLHNTQELI